MKQKVLLKIIKKNGFILYRHGSNHDIYSNGKKKVQIPRHKEINEMTAKTIIKQTSKG